MRRGLARTILTQARLSGKRPLEVLQQGIGEDSIEMALIVAAQRERIQEVRDLMPTKHNLTEGEVALVNMRLLTILAGEV